MKTAYRLCSDRYPANSGKGAAQRGGRWNSVGTEIIYASENAAGAVLEIRVHYSVLPKNFVLTEIRIPDEIEIEYLSDNRLPTNWNAPVYARETQSLGDIWVGEGRFAVISVPSSVVRIERNLLINPMHRDFKSIRFLPSQPFAFDPRLE